MKNPALSLVLAALVLAIDPATAATEAPGVVTSIKPVHSLVANVMKGVGEPHLIIKGGGSPHSYSLRPSDAAALEDASLVVWVGDALEVFLEDPMKSLARKAKILTLAEAQGVTLLGFREGGPWAGEEEHNGHEEHPEPGHGETDMHIWLDPENAKAIVAAVAAALIETDPNNSGVYLANAKKMDHRLDQLSAEISADLAAVKDRPFVVFHDAYQYMQRRFGLNAVGAITISPDRQPGAARLRDMRDKIIELNARCVFAEPQFEPRLVHVLVEGTEAGTGILDPMGAELEDGPELYFELMRRNAAALRDCLSEGG